MDDIQAKFSELLAMLPSEPAGSAAWWIVYAAAQTVRGELKEARRILRGPAGDAMKRAQDYADKVRR